MSRERLCCALLGVLFLGCGRSRSLQATLASTVSSSASAASSSSNAPSSNAPTATTAPRTAEQLLNAWTAALNAADMTALDALYAEQVKFYGQSLVRKEVIARKHRALAALPGFNQQVLGSPSYRDEGDRIRVDFQKHSGVPPVQNDVRSTIVIVKTPHLAISEETDAATERRFARASEDAKPDSCDAAVWALVDSTAFAKKLYADIAQNLKAFPESDGFHIGGIGPFPLGETGGKYQVWIGVHHPERFENYADFSVDAQGKIAVVCMQCEAPVRPISATRAALADFDRLCTTH